MLPGFVAVDQGRICGFTFCVYEGYKAVVGDAFAVENSVLTALETTHVLLRQLLSLLQNSPEVNRMESQLLLYDSGQLAAPFDAARFTTHRRLFMEIDLQTPPASKSLGPATILPHALELQQWTASAYHPAAEFIRSSYVGHIDAQINDQYRSMQGSLRFLHNIVHFPGCGTFDARSSWILRERKSGSLVGLVLCSQVKYDTAHITQLCISSGYRGGKLGTFLLQHAMRKLARSGFEAITLTVTEANSPAVNLYRGLQFATVHCFDAHVFSRT
jgi:ribosomal protein S18 acetylase RimI-like enzyme